MGSNGASMTKVPSPHHPHDWHPDDWERYCQLNSAFVAPLTAGEMAVSIKTNAGIEHSFTQRCTRERFEANVGLTQLLQQRRRQ